MLYHDAHARPAADVFLFGLHARAIFLDLAVHLRLLEDLLAVCSTFRSKMTIQRIHARKVLIAPIARERPIIRVQLFMTLAVMLASKALATPWPLALEWLFFVMRAHVPLEIEASRECAPAARNRADEVRILLSSYAASIRRTPRRHVRLAHNGRGLHSARIHPQQRWTIGNFQHVVNIVLLHHGRLPAHYIGKFLNIVAWAYMWARVGARARR